jgi:hypothetical protein
MVATPLIAAFVCGTTRSIAYRSRNIRAASVASRSAKAGRSISHQTKRVGIGRVQLRTPGRHNR